MFRGLYTSAAGMVAGLKRQEAVTHNLANMQTIGFKSDQTTLTDFPSLLLSRINDQKVAAEVGRLGTGVTLSALKTDFRDGPLKLTDNPFDLALMGDGFFQVSAPDGIRYTRDGRFHANADGILTTAENYPVLGENGSIKIPTGDFIITPMGEIFIEGEYIDRLSLVKFENVVDDLLKDDQTNFLSKGAGPQLLLPQETTLYQGYLEESNVEVAKVVAEMSSILRAYQASQRLIQFQDQINGRTVSEIGRI